MKINEVIRKVGEKYRLLSKKGKNLGTYDSKAGAEKREKQVNYFKHVNEVYDSTNVKKDDVYPDDFNEFIGKARPVAKINGYIIDKYIDKFKNITYLVKNPKGNNYLGELHLGFEDDFYHSEVFLVPELQGKGLAIELYKYAITEDNITIASDITQTPGSKKLWQRLASDPGIFVYKWQPETGEFTHWDDEESDAHISAKPTIARIKELEVEMDAVEDDMNNNRGNREELAQKYENLTQEYAELKDEMSSTGRMRLVATKA